MCNDTQNADKNKRHPITNRMSLSGGIYILCLHTGWMLWKNVKNNIKEMHRI